MYAPKNYLFFAVFLFVLGFASPSVSLASTTITYTAQTTTSNVSYPIGDGPYIIGSQTYSDVLFMDYGSSASVLFFNPSDITLLGSGTLSSGTYTGYPYVRFSTTHGAYFYGCSDHINFSGCWVASQYIPDRGGATYSVGTPGVAVFHSSYDFGGVITPDVTLTPTHTLAVVSPALTLDNADVQPSSAFLTSFSYVDTNYSGDYSDVRFSLSSCDDDTCSTTTLVASDLLSDIRTLLGSGLDGSIYARVPVVLGIPLHYVAILTDADANTQYSSVVFSLTGSYATGLPLPDDALYPTDTTVPDLLSDPSGFVSAMFTNFGNYLVRLVIPPLSFFTDSFSQIQSGFSTKFAFFEQIRSAFVVPADGSFTPISITGLTIAGATIAPLSFISSFNATTFAPFRNFLSMVMYVGLGFWLIKKTSLIFSS